MNKKSDKKLSIITMGCRVNQFESELMRQKIQQTGYRTAEQNQTPDLVIINTCSVTGESDRQARQTIRRTIRAHPNAKVVVTGCYAQHDPDTLAKIPGVNHVMGNDGKKSVAQIIPILEQGESVTPCDQESTMEPPQDMDLSDTFSDKARAYLQVQAGCNEQCTFCIIPKVRGPSRSISIEQAVSQASALIESGFRELVLTGINLGAYGRDIHPETTLETLVVHLLNLPNLGRLRLASIDPLDITPGLMDLFGSSDKLCPHLHLSIQSGDDLILKRMHRNYTRQHIIDVVSELKNKQPRMAFGADIIVGFPTESDEAFHNTLNVVQTCDISLVHAFRYSKRPGTPAADFPDTTQIDGTLAKQRSAQLRHAGQLNLTKLNKSHLNKSVSILVEKVDHNGLIIGKTDTFLPIRLQCSTDKLGSDSINPGDLIVGTPHGLDSDQQQLIGTYQQETKTDHNSSI
ncbi:MAG: tRNA (N(6)-L-threonylcarbamoyladenosine(37)-C(2))-methylthiotransferase MtaB [Magnetococcales bacterium]|nr:tRNA (N(6)-L-threonylcarbamoyladenosine(37)-C(2))-methylthiotransferase MtaB [Magnetococcales bacterium]